MLLRAAGAEAAPAPAPVPDPDTAPDAPAGGWMGAAESGGVDGVAIGVEVGL